MKLISMLCFVLFPFLHNTIYQTTLTTCETDNIVLNYQGEDIRVALFNLNITNEKGWNHTCSMLKEAKQITFEIDASSHIEEPIPVYLFADGKLLQEEIIRNEEGYSIIHNPEYTYEKRLEKLYDTSSTMAIQDKDTKSEHRGSYGYLYLLAFLILWCVLFYRLIYRKRKSKKITKHKKTSSAQ